MHIIGVLNTKGGCGKTTITTCLAVRASKDGLVAVCDLDPQGSYGDWYSRRGAPDNPALLTGAELASDAVESLNMASAYDYVLFDGPPGALMVTEDAVRASHLVVIPMRASGLDINASRDCIQLCEDEGVPFLVVINGSNSRSDQKLVEQTQNLLFNWRVPIAKSVIKHRVAYINAYTTGKTGPEKDAAAATEIDELWREIRAAVRKAAKGVKTSESGL